MCEGDKDLKALVAEVAAAYFSSSHVALIDIPNIIGKIAESLGGVERVQVPSEAPAAEHLKVSKAQGRKSITSDVLISFEDGKAYKSLRRHLSARGLTPEQYREKCGLPAGYPMVSPAYSAARSEFAKKLGLGQRG